MTDKIAYMTEAEWVALLDEIRKKGGTTNKMTAEQARQAVAALKIGGGKSFYKNTVGRNNISNIKEISDDGIGLLNHYSFANLNDLKTVNLPNYKGYFTADKSTPSKYTFYNSRYVDLTNFQQLETVGDYAFAWDDESASDDQRLQFEKISFPNLKKLGKYAFYNNRSFKKINMPVVEEIGDFCFKNNDYSRETRAVEEIYAPNLKIINEGALNAKSLTKLYAPNLTRITKEAFKGCGIRSFDMPESARFYQRYYQIECFSTSVLEKIKLRCDLGNCDNIFGTVYALKYIWISKTFKHRLNKKPWNMFNGNYSHAPKLTMICFEDESSERLGEIEPCKTATISYGVTEAQFDELVKQAGGPID